MVLEARQPIRDTLLDEAVNYFGVGAVREVQQIDTGRTSTNYFVTTTSGWYVMRVMEDFDRVRFENEILVQDALKRAGIQSNQLIVSPRGSYVYEAGDLRITMAKRLKGSHVKRPTDQQECALVGEALGQFHAMLDPDLAISQDYFFLKYDRASKGLDLIEKYRDVLSDLLRYSSDILQYKLPSGILHGDLHGDNVLIHSKSVSILDLQSIGRGPYVLDIGKSLADMCSTDGRIDEDKVRSFLFGYQKARKIEAEEKECLGKAIIYAATHTAIWAVRNHVNELADDFVAVGNAVYILEKNKALSFD